MTEIEYKQLVWYGHVQRMQDHRLQRQALEWTPSEGYKHGRPKAKWV